MLVEGAVRSGHSNLDWDGQAYDKTLETEFFVVGIKEVLPDSFDKVSITSFNKVSGERISLSNFEHSDILSSEIFFGHLRREKNIKVGIYFDVVSKQLLLSRSLFGLVPFHYITLPDGSIWFSTSLSSLVRKRQILPGLSVSSRIIRTFHSFHATDANRIASDTFFNEIQNVLPGHITTLGQGECISRPFVKFDLGRWQGLAASPDYIEVLRETFAECVSNVVSDSSHPIASHLSGGLDSSSVSAMFKHLFPEQPLHTLHHRSETPDMDESEYARAVASHIRSIHHEITQPKNDFELIRRHTSQYGDPESATLSPALMTSMMPLSTELGCHYLLRGNGGDSIIGSGMEALEDAFLKKDWELLGMLLKRRVQFFSLTNQYPGWDRLSDDRKYEIVLQNFLYKRISALQNGPKSELLRFVREIDAGLGISVPYFIKRIVSNFFKRMVRTNVSSPLSILNDELIHLKPSPSAQKIILSDSLLGTMPNRQYQGLFEEIFAPAVMHATEHQFVLARFYGLKSRSPFLDQNLFELCMCVPDLVKYGEGRGREHFRNVMCGILPDKVRTRSGKSTLASAHGQNMTLRLYQQALPFLNDTKYIWEYVDRGKFDSQVNILQNTRIPYVQKVRSWFHITRTVSVAVWLDWFHSLRKSKSI